MTEKTYRYCLSCENPHFGFGELCPDCAVQEHPERVYADQFQRMLFEKQLGEQSEQCYTAQITIMTSPDLKRSAVMEVMACSPDHAIKEVRERTKRYRTSEIKVLCDGRVVGEWVEGNSEPITLD